MALDPEKKSSILRSLQGKSAPNIASLCAMFQPHMRFLKDSCCDLENPRSEDTDALLALHIQDTVLSGMGIEPFRQLLLTGLAYLNSDISIEEAIYLFPFHIDGARSLTFQRSSHNSIVPSRICISTDASVRRSLFCPTESGGTLSDRSGIYPVQTSSLEPLYHECGHRLLWGKVPPTQEKSLTLTMRLAFHLFTLAFDESSPEGAEIKEINAQMRHSGQLPLGAPDYVWLMLAIFGHGNVDAEAIQVLGIHCAPCPGHSEQAIMYIYGLSDFVLYAHLLLPLSFNHYAFGYIPDSKEERLAAACRFSPNDKILDLYFGALGHNYAEYKAHFVTAWEEGRLPQ
jgi:hypothetical protein